MKLLYFSIDGTKPGHFRLAIENVSLKKPPIFIVLLTPCVLMKLQNSLSPLMLKY